MSKNVAVFVDVANIFYAAKAAGVDIDYVTLLRSATAGRDFVRAYAYTGLDPDNENQRQFHAFLARSGYKVVSKDIRKYGDGRIKANLDIELVVDMMRMAEKLDIAVVVSGDGDFAPAITAVQQQGVRVEVISFRGNTSSDLIDVADTFIDIANVAKVEKGVRSGRRVAAEGDLSMTEVPDKESGVTPRRRRRVEGDRPERGAGRRGDRGDRTDRVAREPAPRPDGIAVGSLTALPGEKLSRGAGAPELIEQDLDPETEEVAAVHEPGADDDGGRRRRRRRGGRGRGRSARPGESPDDATSELDEVEVEVEVVAVHPDEVPTLPQHSGFGSVWDSQIGVPVGSGSVLGAPASHDVEGMDEDEPEVPEYLLAEQRQQGRRRDGRPGGRTGRPGRTGGYRTAIDRERYGVGGASSYSRGGGVRSQPGRTGSGPRATAHAMQPIEQTPGGDPWSEVPPEVQELLRAELARRDQGGRSGAAPAAADAGRTAAAPAQEAKPKRAPRARAPKAVAAEATAEAPATEAEPKRAPRARAPKAAADEATVVAPAEEAKPKRAPRKRTTKAEPTEAEAGEA